MDLNRKLFLGTLATFIAYIVLTIPAMLNNLNSNDNFLLINGKKYTESDLKKAGFGPFKGIRKEYLSKLSQVFDSFADEEILRLEAKAQNSTPEAVVANGIGGYDLSQEEIQAVYEMYKSRLQGKKLEEVRPQIVDFLKHEKQGSFRNKLREKYSVNVVTEKPERQKVEEKNNPALGPKDAKITVIEFSDFECPYCKKSQDVTRVFREKYKDKIKWVFRDYPLPFHPNAMNAHIAANCSAQQDKYWDYFNRLFDNSENLQKENILALAKGVGLDMGKFSDCMNDKDGKITSEIQVDIKDGQELGVNGTPAFFINGIMVEGAQPIQQFESIIEKELK